MIATLIGSTGLTGSILVRQLLADSNNQVKGRTEDDVKALGLRSLIIFKPALLVGPRHEFRLAERIAAKTLVPVSRLLPTRAQKSLITEAETLAKRMLAEGKAAAGGVHVIQAKDI